MNADLNSIWKSLRRNRMLWAIGLSSLYCICVLPYVESIALQKEGILFFRIGIRLLFWALLSVGVYYLISFGQALRSGSQRHRDWVIGSITTFLFFGAFLLLTWPGYWSWDEYHILSGVREGDFPRWQGILTAVLFTFYLYLVPSGAFFVLFQVIVVSFVAGYAFSVASELFASGRKLAWLVLLPLLLPASIIMVLYPLRLTIYAMLLVALFFRMIRIFKVKDVPIRPTVELVSLAAVLCVLATWRSEGVFFILLLPIIYWRLGFLSRRKRFDEKRIGATLSLLVVLVSFGASLATAVPRYAVTAIVNPLSIMLQDQSNWRNDDPDLNSLSKILDLHLIARNPSASEIPALWSDEWQDDKLGSSTGFMIPYLSYVSRHPSAFLNARVETFLATSRLQTQHSDNEILGLVQNPFVSDPDSYSPPHPLYKFESDNFWASSLSWDTRKSIILSLLMIDKNGTPIHGHILFWNVFTGLILTFGSLVVSIITRQRLYGMIAISLLAFALMIFLFAPASYFMYYFPIILVGSMICIIQLLEIVSRPRKRILNP
jgi:hypothetical protein